jgi:hypothetical protein
VAKALLAPSIDPTPIFELFCGNHATELLTAAVAHFQVFDRLAHHPCRFEELRQQLGLEERPAVVLLTALRAMKLVTTDSAGGLDVSEQARQNLVAGSAFDITGYIGLAADSPGVVQLVERLRSNRPAGTQPEQEGTAFIYREGTESAMEKEAAARRLTLALAGRARNVAPLLAQRFPLPQVNVLLDVGGGTGLYSIAYLQQHPRLRAIVWDRPEVLKVAAEMAAEYGVADRLECVPGDMFQDRPPAADVVLLSNVLHDWDVPECRQLIARCAAILPAPGHLLIHDVFLNDALDGPLAIALYSAALLCLTEGRAYSGAEYCTWLEEAGLHPRPIVATLVHCGVLSAGRQR